MKKKLLKILTLISPTLSSKLLYYRKFNEKLNLKNPQKFNEKLMWLKLNMYNKDKQVWKCSDKFQVREYAINNGVNESNLPKIINLYQNANNINFEDLPNKFVLKCSHGCGFNYICRDKSKINHKEVKKNLNKWLKTKFGYESAEIHYTHIKPVIICEEYIENNGEDLPIDYKIYCFSGEPKVVLVCFNRKENFHDVVFFDIKWNKLHLREGESIKTIDKPSSFSEMIKIAKKVSKKFPFVRVDFYQNENKAIMGEMTFTPAACLAYYLESAEYELGKMLKLPKDKYYEK